MKIPMAEYTNIYRELNAVIDDSSSAEVASNLENVVTTASSEINTQTNVTFA